MYSSRGTAINWITSYPTISDSHVRFTCANPCSDKAVVGGTAGPAMAGPLFWPKMVLAGPLFRPIIIIIFFLLGDFSADQILSNNIDNQSVHRSMFCLPRGVKLILKLTPLLTTLTIIKRIIFRSDCASKSSLI